MQRLFPPELYREAWYMPWKGVRTQASDVRGHQSLLFLCIPKGKYTCIHTHTNTYTHAHIYTCTHTNAHIHTCKHIPHPHFPKFTSKASRIGSSIAPTLTPSSSSSPELPTIHSRHLYLLGRLSPQWTFLATVDFTRQMSRSQPCFSRHTRASDGTSFKSVTTETHMCH